MDQRVRKLLEDIRQAIGAIEEFTSGKAFDDYKTDLLLRSAVERQFLVVGEAVAQLATLNEAMAGRLGDYRRIIDFRNILVHGYSVLDDRIVWETAQDDLPVLKEPSDPSRHDPSRLIALEATCCYRCEGPERASTE